jgi:hypothetical protein
MVIQGKVGAGASGQSHSDGLNLDIRQGAMGDVIISQLHGRFSETTNRKNMFAIANQGGVTHSAALTTTFVGICVGNPSTSTVNLHMLGFGWSLLVACAATASIGIMTGLGTITGALTPRNRYVGQPAGQGLATGGMTLPGTPVLEQVFGQVGTVAITAWGPTTTNHIDLGGSLILPPGTFVASYMTTAPGASGFIGSFLWEEVPI